MSTLASKGVSTEAEETPAAGFEIDGKHYEIPALNTLTLAEEEILYTHANSVVQDFIPAHPSWNEQEKATHNLVLNERVRNPRLKGTLAYIAYRRKNPDVSEDEGLAIIRNVNALELDVAMLAPEDDADPPALSSQNEPESSNGHIEPSSLMDSGSPIDASLGEAAWTQPRTGITESDTSSRLSPEELSGI